MGQKKGGGGRITRTERGNTQEMPDLEASTGPDQIPPHARAKAAGRSPYEKRGNESE